jgi:hypothetical protein
MTQYRATKPLFVGNARAHNIGDLVDSERVQRYGWQKRVEKVSSDEAPTPTPRKKPGARKKAEPKLATPTRKSSRGTGGTTR